MRIFSKIIESIIWAKALMGKDSLEQGLELASWWRPFHQSRSVRLTFSLWGVRQEALDYSPKVTCCNLKVSNFFLGWKFSNSVCNLVKQLGFQSENKRKNTTILTFSCNSPWYFFLLSLLHILETFHMHRRSSHSWAVSFFKLFIEWVNWSYQSSFNTYPSCDTKWI